MPPRKGGRRVLLNKHVQWTICDAVAKGQTLHAAANAAGIHPATLRRWLKHGRDARRGKFHKLVVAVDEARARLRQELDHTEWEILTDKDQPGSTRLRAVEMVRRRVFDGLERMGVPTGVIDVYHHHEHTVSREVEESTAKEETPPQSLITDSQLQLGDDEELEAALAALRDVQHRLEDRASEDSPDIIDSSEVA